MIPAAITRAAGRCADHEVTTEERRDCDSRQHPVRHRVPEEGQAAQDDPGADAPAQHRGEHTGDEGAEDEGHLEGRE